MSHNQNNDIMKPTDYIEWDNLKESVMNKNSLELFSLLSENSHVTDEQMQNAYKSFVEQITTISQSQQSYPEVFRMLNRTRIELDSLESSSLYELEKK